MIEGSNGKNIIVFNLGKTTVAYKYDVEKPQDLRQQSVKQTSRHMDGILMELWSYSLEHALSFKHLLHTQQSLY